MPITERSQVGVADLTLDTYVYVTGDNKFASRKTEDRLSRHHNIYVNIDL